MCQYSKFNKLLKEYDLLTDWDSRRETWNVDVAKIREVVDVEKSSAEVILVEGHLSHWLDSQRIILLRCEPKELHRRLIVKGWSPEKIRENVEAEILDTIKSEVYDGKRPDVLEIETSRHTVERSAMRVKGFISKIETGKSDQIDWLTMYNDWLINGSLKELHLVGDLDP